MMPPDEQSDALIVAMTDADRALMRTRQRLATLPIEIRAADLCPRCGQHMVVDEATRLQFFASGGTATCAHCAITKICKPYAAAGATR
jgi:hypothetical protein